MFHRLRDGEHCLLRCPASGSNLFIGRGGAVAELSLLRLPDVRYVKAKPNLFGTLPDAELEKGQFDV